MKINGNILIQEYYTAKKKNELLLLNHMDKTHRHNIRQKKSDTKEDILYDSSYMASVVVNFVSTWLSHGAQQCGHTILDVSVTVFLDDINILTSEILSKADYPL